MSESVQPSLSYRDAGVDIDAGDALVDALRPIVQRTARDGCLSQLGGFGGLFEIPTDRYRQPVLVSGTDGVGTKLKLAFASGRHDTIGVDLVAMCVNDVIVHGAEPLFFLDYFATGRLDPETARTVLQGVGHGCEQAGAALIGGETAEMPGMYAAGEYDLAGFCVGVVEKSAIIDGSRITPGDAVIGLRSSGPHANGYSLIRKILESSGSNLESPWHDSTLGDALLTPTKIYVRPLLRLLADVQVHGVAHITGGGITGNIRRVIPDTMRAVLDSKAWPEPEIFSWLQSHGNIDTSEMYRTFNCGLGMVIVVAADDTAQTLDVLDDGGKHADHIGYIEAHSGEPRVAIQ